MARAELVSLLEAVKRHPLDVPPRLVLADWLEEHGDAAERARGEYVRLHCRPHRVPLGHDEREADPDLKASRKAHQAGWLGPLRRSLTRRPGWRWSLEGGLACVTAAGAVTPGQLHAAAAAVTGALADPARADFAGAWAWVNTVACKPDSVERLASDGLPVWPGVRTLNLGFSNLGEAGGRALAGCAALAELSALLLFVNALGAAGLAGLLGSRHLGGLGYLNVGTNDLNDDGAVTLAERVGDAAPALTALGVYVNGLTAAGVAALAGCPALAGLRHLDLSFNNFGDGGARALAESAHLTKLRDLDLEQTHLGSHGARALAQADGLGGLESLTLRTNRVTAGGASALFRSRVLRRLRVLDLQGNRVGVSGLEALARGPVAAGLEYLSLAANQLDDRCAEALARAPLTRLRRLVLTNNAIGDAGARALAASPALAGLVALGLQHNHIGDGGAAALAESPHLGQLRSLELIHNPTGPAGARALRRRFGRAVVS